MHNIYLFPFKFSVCIQLIFYNKDQFFNLHFYSYINHCIKLRILIHKSIFWIPEAAVERAVSPVV